MQWLLAQMVQFVAAVDHRINTWQQETGVRHKLCKTETEDIWYSQKININNLTGREFGTNILIGS